MEATCDHPVVVLNMLPPDQLWQISSVRLNDLAKLREGRRNDGRSRAKARSRP